MQFMAKGNIDKLKEEINASSNNGEIVVRNLKKILYSDMSFLTLSYFNKTVSNLIDVVLPRLSSLKVAIICNATIEPFDQYLKAESFKYDLLLEVYISDHYRYAEEIMNENSELYKKNIDLFIFVFAGEELRPDLFLRFTTISAGEKKDAVTQTVSIINGFVDKIKSVSNAPLILCNFVLPGFLSTDIVDNDSNGNEYGSFNELNNKLKKISSFEHGIHYFDLDGVVNMFGKRNYRDMRRWYLAKQLFSNSFMPMLSNECMRRILPITGKTRKCLIVDLDNVLWGGIIGEDGFENIELGESPKGRAYVHLQHEILKLHKKGVLLAINSKNNFEDVMEVFDKHLDMILSKNHFSSMKINWNDKVENIISIANDLNIGTDSMVFFDDSPGERELVRLKLPEVLVPEIPEDAAYYVEILNSLPVFNSLVVTDVDKDRGRLYTDELRRSDSQKKFTDITDFYEALEIKVFIGRADKFSIPRISQLTMKTNQFNLTTRRYLPEKIIKFANSDEYLVLWLRSEDKYGDNGIVAVAIIKQENHIWQLDTFLMSCRVIGRTIEKAFLSYIISMAKNENVTEIKAEYKPTKKNKPAENFLSDNGFSEISEINGTILWGKEVNELNVECPPWVKIIDEDILVKGE